MRERRGGETMLGREEILEQAFAARGHAYAPYSGFAVGACVKTKDGRYFLGANVENAAYGSTNCAERNAVFAAYSNGVRKEDIEALAIVTKADRVTTPCGACRQVLSELLDADTPIYLSNGRETRETNIRRLLPYAFGSESMS